VTVETYTVKKMKINAVSIHQIIFMKKICITVSTKMLSGTTIFNIDNNKKYSRARDQLIRMISEGSHVTEDWSNDAENSAL